MTMMKALSRNVNRIILKATRELDSFEWEIYFRADVSLTCTAHLSHRNGGSRSRGTGTQGTLAYPNWRSSPELQKINTFLACANFVSQSTVYWIDWYNDTLQCGVSVSVCGCCVFCFLDLYRKFKAVCVLARLVIYFPRWICCARCYLSSFYWF